MLENTAERIAVRSELVGTKLTREPGAGAEGEGVEGASLVRSSGDETNLFVSRRRLGTRQAPQTRRPEVIFLLTASETRLTERQID